MKITPLRLALLLLMPTGLFAQNFSGSDDFTTNNFTQWGTETGQNGGTFSISGGTLQYNDGGLDASSTSMNSYATRAWIVSAGSYTSDWQVQMDFTLPNPYPGTSAAQNGDWTMILLNGDNSNDYFAAQLSRYYGSSTPIVQAGVTTGGTPGSSTSSSPLTGNTATIRVSYNASTTTLTAAYHDTSSSIFTDLWNISVGASGENWNMTSGSSFNLAIRASHNVMTATSAAIATDTWTADNLLLSPTAVPEPATIALVAGVAVLGFCFWRRQRI